MISRTKLYSQLDRMESELAAELRPHLEQAANGDNPLVFCVAEFNPNPAQYPCNDTNTEKLVRLGRQILALREKLGEPADGTPAERLCWYCRQWAATANGEAKTARELAADFLQEILKPPYRGQ